ncbi:MAG: hypothetical protein P8N76_28005 [Pirellulaceae bacterium]|nr:hypothetical protein [Pirellulaceae bacterium]
MHWTVIFRGVRFGVALALVGGLFGLQTLSGQAGEIGFIEDFSLASDRDLALEKLIPGTEEYYYFQCLHQQNLQQFDRVEQLLAAWIKRHNVTSRVQEIQNRQALLTYRQHPQKSLTFLQRQLGLQFNHQRDTVDRAAQLPTQLDAQLISRQRLTQVALKRHRNTLNGFEDSALDWLALESIDATHRRDLLKRMQRPDVTGLPEIVIADLNTRNSGGFGSFQIHRNLLKDQLDQCLVLKPSLRNETKFVNTYLSKLQPSSDVNMQFDRSAREAFLSRLWGFAETLDPSHNSLKAHVLYHQLTIDESQGKYNRERFLAYLKLPRVVDYVSRKYLEQSEHKRHQVNLNADFQSVTRFPPIRNDHELVRRYLQHFFVDAKNYRDFSPYVKDLFLKHLFAETKIVHGLGDPQQWYSQLPPEAYQRLKQRVDLDFLPTNPQQLGASEAATIGVNVKNVSNLIVKVYRINALNFYKDQGRNVSTGINLDGLIPNEERAFEYKDPPLRRIRREFEFESLSKPGIYVIDFIGNGKSSRALLQKGKLRHVVRSTSAGMEFSIFDENELQLNDASLWIGGQLYHADGQGNILVPFSSQPGRQRVILIHDQTVTLARFEHEAESYAMKVGFYTDRESLLSGRIAKLLVRPGLLLNKQPVGLALLKNVQLTISSTNKDGITSTDTVSNLKLQDDVDYVHEFRVPPRLAQISVSLNAQVDSLSQGKDIDLVASDDFSVASAIQHRSEAEMTKKHEFRTGSLHLSEVKGEHFVDLLGKSGEPRPNRPVQLKCKHRDFRDPVSVTLRTNDQGRISLGTLEEIAWISATAPDGAQRQWKLRLNRHSYYRSVNGRVGQPIKLSAMGASRQPRRDEMSLLEMRHGQYVADRFDAIRWEDGQWILSGLAAGDYQLTLKHLGEVIQVRITEGVPAAGYVLGRFRQLEMRGRDTVLIESVDVKADKIQVQLGNSSPFSRVHVFATTFRPEYDAYSRLAKVRDAEPAFGYRVPSSCLYVEGRTIGDEYRYVLDRKYAQKFPGNMLARPELLLNPWAIRDTETAIEELAEDSDFADEAALGPAQKGRLRDRRRQSASGTTEFDLNFLADASFVRLNARPDADGRIQVDRDELKGKQTVVIVAVDPLTTSVRYVDLPQTDSRFLDLRLATGLQSDANFSQQNQISVVEQGQTFQLDDIRSSKFEMYDSLPRVYQLYETLQPSTELNDFRFVLQWNQMTNEEKRERYSKYACHELDFFISEKDPEFFDAVIQPYLRQKLNKTFLDHYLIRDDLTAFLSPWNYQQLNVVERILLARRVAGEQPITVETLRNAANLIPPDVEQSNYLFDMAIAGQSLESVGGLAFAAGGGMGGVGGVVLGIETQAEDGAARSDTRRYRKNERENALQAEPPMAPEGESVDAGIVDRADKSFAAFGEPSLEGREKSKIVQLYRALDQTQEWAENNYYQLPIEKQNGELVEVNSFWVEFARHDETKPFYSTALAMASNSFTEIMFALSVLDLPFESPQHETVLVDNALKVISAGPMIVYHQQIQPTKAGEDESPLLVSQNFFQQNDRYRQVDNQQVDKFVNDEFLPQTVYGCLVVVTNPTSSAQELDVLTQIPRGAIPVGNGGYTDNEKIRLEPYRTHALEYYFYFPAIGEFDQFPVHVSEGETLVAAAVPFKFKVVKELSQVDRQSWEYVSQLGSDEDVLAYLRKENLGAVQLDRIAFRMADLDFFEQAIGILQRRHAYNQTLWSYSIKHNQPNFIDDYLQHCDEFVSQCGSMLQSPLLVIRPVARRTYQHLEYRPLVNARSHQIGSQRQILNDRLFDQYNRWLKLLSYVAEPSAQDRLSTIYYLLTQDRVAEALEMHGEIDPVELETRMQYDYCTAYLSFSSGDLALARSIAERYVNYPVDRWRNSFALVRNQLDEIEGNPSELVDESARDQFQERMAASQPTFDFAVESKIIDLSYANLNQVRVNYYLMDIELLFSRSPFVQKYSGQFSYIQPNLTQVVDLAGDQTQSKIELPEALQNQNVLVEIEAAGRRQSNAYYSNSISAQVSGNYGQLRVATQASNEPIAAAYVKVYAQMKDGTISFYKDGYTDRRGRFDYSSLSTDSLDNVQRFAVLILSDEAGALVREVSPPKQ